MEENINVMEQANNMDAEEIGRIIRKSVFPQGVKKSLIYNVRNDAVSLAKADVDVLTLMGVIMTRGRKAVTKELCTNTYFVTDDGKAYFTQSDGIKASADDMLDLYDDDVNGLVIRIITQEIGNGRTMKRIRIMD